jgi:hypothetical protein
MAHHGFPSPRQARTLARGLGWFSIGLGLVELLAARRVARAVGLPGQAALVACCGLREIATGVGLLRSARPAAWLWGRVGGDALDTAVLATGLAGRDPVGAAVALGAVAGVTALDVACARSLSRAPHVEAADYRRRSGWPLPAAEMRGAALEDFMPPRDLRVPEALRPWGDAPGAG